jgi:hypothetical protein
MSTQENFAEQTGYRRTREVIRAPLTADDVARGVRRALLAEGLAPICEFKLSNARRMDVAAVGADGSFVGVEIKVALADLKADDKWPEYLPWCDFFYFAVPPEFPQAALPVDWGLIVADKFGGEIVRPSTRTALSAARRRALTLRFAQSAAERLTRVLDPGG